METESLIADKTFMVGDRKFDLVGAQENNVRKLAVSYGYGSYEEISAYDPEEILNSPEAIRRYFSEI